MSRLAEAQSAFATALLEPQLRVPLQLRGVGEPAQADRFAVYRNNVMVGLIEGLRDAYPVVCRLVGDEFFRAMAGVFARAHPPASPVMLEYGAGFAEFIAGFPPTESLPYLPHVACLERAWVEAYHASEGEPLASVAACDPKHIRVHPATRLVRSRFPVLAIWEVNQSAGEPQALELSDEGENVLVTRPAAEVQVCRIPDEAADLVRALAVGESICPNEHLEQLCSLGAFTMIGADE